MNSYIPLVASSGGEALTQYLAADPRRQAIYDNLCARLEPLGRVGSLARYYIVRVAARRRVFREILAILHARFPDWSMETDDAATANQKFKEQYREEYNAFRRDLRNATKRSCADV